MERNRSTGFGKLFGSMSSDAGRNPDVFRVGGVSYLQIPAHDPLATAAFYAAVFGWRIHDRGAAPSFADGSGHVIGHFVADVPVAGEAGVRPYIFVGDVDEALGAIAAHGGEVVTAPYPEGDLWVATYRDPAGNVLGIWQTGPRRAHGA